MTGWGWHNPVTFAELAPPGPHAGPCRPLPARAGASRPVLGRAGARWPVPTRAGPLFLLVYTMFFNGHLQKHCVFMCFLNIPVPDHCFLLVYTMFFNGHLQKHCVFMCGLAFFLFYFILFYRILFYFILFFLSSGRSAKIAPANSFLNRK